MDRRLRLLAQSVYSQGFLLLAGVIAAAYGTTAAYGDERPFKWASVPDSPNIHLYWPQRTISYYVNDAGSKTVTDRKVLVTAIKKAFFSWASAECTDLNFVFAGYISATNTDTQLGTGEQPDYKNLIIWRGQGQWPPPGYTGTVADTDVSLTTRIYDDTTGQLKDVDIDLNESSVYWSTNGSSIDVQTVLTHEVGHLLGFDDSPKALSIMASSVPTKTPQIRHDLSADDVQGVCFVYPFQDHTPISSSVPNSPNQVKAGCGLGAASARGLLFIAFVTFWLLHYTRTRRRRSRTEKRGESDVPS